MTTDLVISLSRTLADTAARQGLESDLACLTEVWGGQLGAVLNAGHRGPLLRLVHGGRGGELRGRWLRRRRGRLRRQLGGARDRLGCCRGSCRTQTRERHLVRVLLCAVEGDGPRGQGGGVPALVLDLELPGAGGILSPAEHGEERPVVESGSGAVVRPAGEKLGLGAARRGQVHGDVAPPGGLHRHVGLDVLQEVHVPVVGDLHLGGPAAAGGDAHLTDAGLDSTLDLGADIFPPLGHLDHPAGVHHTVAK